MICEALLLCDQVVKDPGTGRCTVLGVFDRIAGAVPLRRKVTVYIRVAAEEGRRSLTLGIRSPDGEEHREGLTLEVRGGIAHADVGRALDLTFGAEGRYEFTLDSDGVRLGETWLDIENRPVMFLPNGKGVAIPTVEQLRGKN